jgi:hypothetical protein
VAKLAAARAAIQGKMAAKTAVKKAAKSKVEKTPAKKK